MILGAKSGQKDIFDVRTNAIILWKTPLYQYQHYYQWHFLDSTHIIGRSDHQLHLFIRDRDSLVNLSQTKLNFYENGDHSRTNQLDEIVFEDVGILNNQIISVSSDSVRFWNMDGVFQNLKPYLDLHLTLL